jgi:pilus assembly protein CpaB
VDAQKLALAQQVGSLSLVLRNVADQDNPVVATVATDDLRDGAYVGAYSGPRVGYASAGASAGSVTPRWRPVRRRAPSVPKTAKVEIVRGLTGSSYEVKRHAGF